LVFFSCSFSFSVHFLFHSVVFSNLQSEHNSNIKFVSINLWICRFSIFWIRSIFKYCHHFVITYDTI
jgi:hypothetical protein